MFLMLFLVGEIYTVRVANLSTLRDFSIVNDTTALLLYKDYFVILNLRNEKGDTVPLNRTFNSIDVGKDGVYLINTGGQTVDVYRLNLKNHNIENVNIATTLPIKGISFSPFVSYPYLITAPIGNTQYLFEKRPDSLRKLSSFFGKRVIFVKHTLRGNYIISWDRFYSVLFAGKGFGARAIINSIHLPAISPSGNYFLYSSSRGNVLKLSGKKIESFSSPEYIYAIVWDMPGKLGFIIGNYLLAIVSDTTLEKIRCPACGYINEWKYNFCINCGQKLLEAKQEKLSELREMEVLNSIQDGFNALAEKIKEEKAVLAEKEKKPPEKKEKVKPKQRPKPKIVVPKTEKPIKENIVVVKKKKIPFPEMETPSFFEVPKGRTVRSLTIYASGGGAFATAEEGYSPLGSFIMGFGDIFQVELSTMGVINTLLKASSVLPALSFKMDLTNTLRDRLHLSKNAPILSIGLRATLWNSFISNGITYSSRYAYLFGVIEKKVWNFDIAGGISICDTRAKTTYTSEVVKNPFLLFAGVEYHVRENSYMVFEVSQLSGYRFHEDGTVSPSDLEKGMWWSIGGKSYITKWLVVNASARFDAKEGRHFSGPADAKLWAGISLLLPVDYFYNITR